MTEMSACIAMLEALRDPSMIIDSDERITAINHPMKALVPSLRIKDPLALAIRTPDLLDSIRLVLSGQSAQSIQWREHVPIERVFDVFVAPLTLDNNRLHVLVTMRDLTEIKRTERMRVDFIANASHELRTPLASLLGFVETLQGPAREDKAAREHFLKIMVEQGRRMSRLIDDLLSLSRVEQHQHLQPTTHVDLVVIVRQVVESFSPLAPERHVKLILEAPDSLSVIGDRDELIRLAENLIGNAIKYGSLPDRETQVNIIVSQIDSEASLSVRDHGAGIPPEHIPRLTERFYRIDTNASRANGGTGLGLALVKHILLRHRGWLRISSKLNEGSCFEALLPLS
jgi:two-component system phosphate regulon sensor histidine kinase PhoR